jgi:MarR family transcriptional regulator, organic hydroperoxide resistance regulator
MAKRSNTVKAKAAGKTQGTAASGAASNENLSGRFFWDVTSISIHLDQIRQHWAKVLGITGPQWVILVAVADLGKGAGVPVKDVVAQLLVDPSFVTTQSKILEKAGLLRRSASASDARIVLLSLTEKASREMESLSTRQRLLEQFIFSDFDARTLGTTMKHITTLREKIEKATLRLAADI